GDAALRSEQDVRRLQKTAGAAGECGAVPSARRSAARAAAPSHSWSPPMSDLVSVLRAIIRDELRSLQLGDIAVVSKAYPHAEEDAHNYECDVTLRESGLVFKKVPMATPHIGMASLPQEGDLVYLSYVGGDANRPIVLGRLYSEKANPPAHAADEVH